MLASRLEICVRADHHRFGAGARAAVYLRHHEYDLAGLRNVATHSWLGSGTLRGCGNTSVNRHQVYKTRIAGMSLSSGLLGWSRSVDPGMHALTTVPFFQDISANLRTQFLRLSRTTLHYTQGVSTLRRSHFRGGGGSAHHKVYLPVSIFPV